MLSPRIEAIIKLAVSDHQTGSIFDAESFRAIPERSRYFEISDMFPEVYVIRDLLMKGNGAEIKSGVNVGKHVIDYAKVKSRVEHDINIFNTYFAPARRIKQTIEMIDMIEIDLRGKFNDYEINRLFSARFSQLLIHVTLSWKYNWCGNYLQMAHYGQQVRHVGINEINRNAIIAYNEIIKHLKDKGTYTYSKRMIMNCCIVKIIIRTYLQIILKYLGIWNILKYIKRTLKNSHT